MRKFVQVLIFALTCACGCGTVSFGQQNVFKATAPKVFMRGSFQGGTYDTTGRWWGLKQETGVLPNANYPLFSARRDTVTHTAAFNDSVWCSFPQYANCLSIEIQAKQVGAVRADSTVFYVWGSKSGADPYSGTYKLLTSFTMANTTNQQVFQYDFNSGGVWDFTGFRITAVNGNLSTYSSVDWTPKLIFR